MWRRSSSTLDNCGSPLIELHQEMRQAATERQSQPSLLPENSGFRVGMSPVPGRGPAGPIPALFRRTLRRMTTTAVRAAPAAVQMSVVLWLAAIGAGVVEAL